MAWLTSWNYRKSITISNAGSTLSDYQVVITVDTVALISSGKMLSNCSDMRFVDDNGSTLLNYWIESGINTTSTKIWIKIPSIPTSTKTIYIYYGNATPPGDGYGSDTTNTFPFFDDFPGSTLDTGKWTTEVKAGVASISYSVSGSALVINTTSANALGTYAIVKGLTNYSPGTAIRFRQYNSSTSQYPGVVSFGKYYDYPTSSLVGQIIWSSHLFALGSSNAGVSTYSSAIGTDNAWHIYDVKWQSTKVEISKDGTILKNITTTINIPTISLPISMGDVGQYGGAASNTQIDWILVHKYEDPEPTVSSIGTEQTPGSLRIISTPSGALIYLALHNQTPLSTGIYTPDPVTGLAPGNYDIKLTNNGYQDWTYANATISSGTETQLSASMVPLATPAHITATNMTIAPSATPCIVGCTVTVDVIWTNTGETSGSFTPSIKVDGSPVVTDPVLTPVSVGPSLTASQQFIITGLTIGTHNICPDPN